jgi:hypothetical protein
MGDCRECGFDLAGLPGGPGVCPECGTAYADGDAWRCAPLPTLLSQLLVGCFPSILIAGAFIVVRHNMPGSLWVALTAAGAVLAYGLARMASQNIAAQCFPARVRANREVAIRGGLVACNLAILLTGSAFVFA